VIVRVYYEVVEWLEVSSSNEDYVYREVTEKDYMKVLRYLKRGWEGRAWQVIRNKPFFKREKVTA
jgi:hypothetical protein